MSNIPEADLLPITADLSGDGRLAVGGCDVRDLVAEYGSPLYIYDEATLRGMCRDFVGSFTSEYEILMLPTRQKPSPIRLLPGLSKKKV